MAIRVNAKNQKTKDFLAYIVKTIAEKEDLKQYDEVKILIQKDKTPFPKFEHYAHNLGSDYDAIEIQIKSDKNYDEKGSLISEYLNNNFQQGSTFPLSKRKSSKPLIFEIRAVVGNPFEIFKLHAKLKAETSKKNPLKTQKKDKESKLLTKPLRIAFRGKEIPVRERTIQSDVCKLMLRKPLNTIIELDQIVDKVYGKDVENPKTKLKNIENAFYLINSKVKKSTGKSIFSYGSKRFIKIA
jgi:hypothetical protein